MNYTMVSALNEGRSLRLDLAARCFKVIDGDEAGLDEDLVIRDVKDLSKDSVAARSFRATLERALGSVDMEYSWYKPLEGLITKMHESAAPELHEITMVFHREFGKKFGLSDSTPAFLKSDREFVKRVMFQKDPYLAATLFMFVDESLRQDPEFVLELLSHGIRGIFERLDSSFKATPDFYLRALEISPSFGSHVPKELLVDRDFVKSLLQICPFKIRDLGEDMQHDIELAMIALRANPKVFMSLCLSFRDNIDIATQAINAETSVYRYASDRLKHDRAFSMFACSKSWLVYSELPQEFKLDPEFLFQAITGCQSGYVLRYAPKELKENKDVMLQACRINGDCFRNLSEDLRDDRDLAFVSIQTKPQIFSEASLRLRADKELAIEAISKNSTDAFYVFKALDPSLKKDKEVVLCAFSICPRILSRGTTADPELKKDAEFLLSLIQINEMAYEFVDHDLACDEGFIKAAFRKNPNINRYASFDVDDKDFIKEVMDFDCVIVFCMIPAKYKADKEFILPYLKKHPDLYELIDDSLKQDVDLVLELIQIKPEIFRMLPESMKKDKRVIMHLLESCTPYNPIISSLLQSAKEHFNADEDVAKLIWLKQRSSFRLFNIKLLATSPSFIRFVLENRIDDVMNHLLLGGSNMYDELLSDKSLVLEIANVYPKIYLRLPLVTKQDPDVAVSCINQNGMLFSYAPESIRQRKDIAIIAIQRYPEAIRFAAGALKADKEIALHVVNQNGDLLHVLDDAMRDDIDVARAALFQNPDSFKHASIRLKTDKPFVIEALSRDARLVQFAPSFYNDRDIALLVVQSFGNQLSRFHPTIRADREVVLRALANNIEARHAMDPVLLQDPEIRMLILNAEAVAIGGRRMLLSEVPAPVQAELLADFAAAGEGTWQHLLTADMPAFIDSLTQAETGAATLAILEERKAGFHAVLAQLVTRITERQAYLGTPPADHPDQLDLFYDNICTYLSQIDAVLAEGADKRLERLQILDAAGVCGGGLLGHLEQLHARLCSDDADLSCAARLAKWRGIELRSFVDFMVSQIAQVPNVHDSNIITWQLRHFIGGQPIHQDHLAHPIDEFELLTRLYQQRNAAQMATSLVEQLKADDSLQESVLDYVENHMFEGAAPSEEVAVLLAEEVASMPPLFAQVQELRAALTVTSGAAGEPIDVKFYANIRLAPSAASLKTMIRQAHNIEISDELAALYFANKAAVLELSQVCIKLKQISGVSSLELFELDLAGVHARLEAYRPSRIKELSSERFLEAYRDEEGHFTQVGAALILQKCGLLKEV